MVNPLSSYYLQQMGIQIWVERQTSKQKELARLRQYCDAAVSSCGNPDAALMVIAQQPLTDKAELLFKRMLQSVGLDGDDAYIASSESIETLHRQLDVLAPKVVLDLTGADSRSLSFSGAVVTTYHPLHLLQYPKDKKNVFKDLQRLKNLMNNVV